MTGLTALIALDGATLAYDKLYTYVIPPVLQSAALPGCRVTVPFGGGNIKKQGMIFRTENAELKGLKPILSVTDNKPVLNGDMLTVDIPGYRDDVDGYPDIAQEIIRMYGYEHILPTFLEKASVTGGGLDDKQKQELHLKTVLLMVNM